MSGSNTAAYEQWCNEARAILNIKQVKSLEVHKKLAELGNLLSAKPEELNDTEWNDYVTLRDRANQNAKKGDAGKPTRPFPSAASVDVGLFIDRTETLANSIKQRQQNYAQVQNDAFFNNFSGPGKTLLKTLGSPEKAVAEAKKLTKDANDVMKKFTGLAGYYDQQNCTTILSNIKAAITDLDFSDASDGISILSKVQSDAQNEKTDVEVLKSKVGSPNDAPQNAAGWRNLAERERRFGDLKKKIVKAISDGEISSVDSKRQQIGHIRGPIETQVSSWPNKTITEKFSDDDHTQGTLPWFDERLKVLVGPTAGNATDSEAALLAQEWAALMADVSTQWQAYVSNNYNKALRGPFAPAALMTARVKAKCAATQTFSTANRTFTKSNSHTADVSFHTPIPQQYYETNASGQLVMSFVYHI
jgi:hypothetical protein